MAALVSEYYPARRLILTTSNIRILWALRGVLESNSDLEPQSTIPSSPSANAGSSTTQSVAVQLLDHGTGSGVKKPLADRWARSRAKAAQAATDPK
eukprot:COSAG02_NODE_2090_length_9866_cov_9.396642_2_plen_96_part_00